MKTKRLIILSLTPLLFISCSSKNLTYSDSAPMLYQESRGTSAPAPMPVDSYSMMTPRRVATSANIGVDVDNTEEAQEALKDLISNVKGYIEHSNLSKNGHYYATIKVPSSNLEETLENIAKLGEKTSQSINKRDITNGFINNEERLKNLKLFRDKMKTLLNRSTKIDDILRIEREINRVQTEIDRLERQLKSMQSSVDMSPISVTLKEKTIYGPVGYVGHGLWWAVKKLFIIR